MNNQQEKTAVAQKPRWSQTEDGVGDPRHVQRMRVYLNATTGYEGVCGTVEGEDVAEDGGQCHAFARGKIVLQGQDETADAAGLPHQPGNRQSYIVYIARNTR